MYIYTYIHIYIYVRSTSGYAFVCVFYIHAYINIDTTISYINIYTTISYINIDTTISPQLNQMHVGMFACKHRHEHLTSTKLLYKKPAKLAAPRVACVPREN